jgi:hypothetical protein
MGPYVETTESATPTLLVLSTESILVRITLCGVDAPHHGMTCHLHECNLGSPLREICSAGSATGDRHKRPCRKTRPYPPPRGPRVGYEVRPASGGRSTHPAIDPEMAQGRSVGERLVVGNEDGNATSGGDLAPDGEQLSSLCIRPVGPRLAAESGTRCSRDRALCRRPRRGVSVPGRR